MELIQRLDLILVIASFVSGIILTIGVPIWSSRHINVNPFSTEEFVAMWMMMIAPVGVSLLVQNSWTGLAQWFICVPIPHFIHAMVRIRGVKRRLDQTPLRFNHGTK